MKRMCLRAAALAGLLAFGGAASARDLPDFGLMLNNDGDLSFTSADPQESVRDLRERVGSLAGMSVKTLMYSVGAGSDVLYYPTKVASVWGWRKTRYDEDKVWGPRIAKIKAGMAAGIDPIRVAGEKAKEAGLFFVPSYRMNDDHFMSDPFEYPLTGEFWMRNHARFILGESPILGNPDYRNLLDFSHAEVREYRLAVLFEVIERYQDIMAGIEMDFNRVQVLFPPGKARAGAPLVTDMVAEVRSRLDELGRKNGRPYALFVRVPPALKNCHWAGLEVEDWMKRGLVDVVIPSQLMTLAHDMPVGEFVAIARPAGVRVCLSLYPRFAWTWPFTKTHQAGSYAGSAAREATPELILGAASNYRLMGASGFQLFNFGLPPYEGSRPALRYLAGPVPQTPVSKSYAITPAYYLDHEDSYEYKKQTPADLQTGEEHTLTLIVGDDLAALKPPPDYCALRLGFVGVTPDAEMVIKINGNVLHTGALGDDLVAVTGKLPRSQGPHPPAPTSYFQAPLRDLGFLKQGVNSITIEVNRIRGEAKARLVEAQLFSVWQPH